MLVLFNLLYSLPCHADRPEDTLLWTLDNQQARPFTTNAEASVFIFLSTTCPISNSYAPEIRRLEDRFKNRKVSFTLIYPDPNDAPELIRRHVKDFSLPLPVLRDPQHHFSKATGVTVTPEAIVFLHQNKITYCGRIDDRHISFGVERPRPTHHDLQDAIEATLKGHLPTNPRTPVIGCYIADLK